MKHRPFIYFDMGNVLLTFSHQKGARQMAEVSGIAPELAWRVVFDDGLHWEYERGEISDKEFHERFCKATGSQPDLAALERAGSDIFEVNLPVLPLLSRLRTNGCQLGVLSNTSAAHWRFVTREFPVVFEMFEVFALSFQIGSMKPDAAIYQRAQLLADVPAAELLFFDDRPENVAAAKLQGWDAAVFSDAATFARDLENRGILLH